MRERGIIMGPESVRALLAGSKSQTRGVIVPQPHPWPLPGKPVYGASFDASDRLFAWHAANGDLCNAPRFRCPYGAPGDKLFVKESWTRWCSDEGCDKRGHIAYRADASAQVERMTSWRSPLYMPRWAFRLTLEVVAVRVERLHAIQEDDARAEGVTWPAWEDFEPVTFRFKDGALDPHGDTTLTGGPARCAFERAWDAINGKRGFPWSANPWVWALTFRVVAARSAERMG